MEKLKQREKVIRLMKQIIQRIARKEAREKKRIKGEWKRSITT